MRPPRGVALIAAAAACCAAAFDSRNVSDAEWVCDGGVAISFGGAVTVACGTEVLQDASQAQPVLTFVNASAPADALYTIIIVDRDAPSEASPVRSPLRHYAAGNVPAAALAAGSGAEESAWFNYSGPQPPAGSVCHRYYAMLYLQSPGVTPELEDPTSRLQWDFPGWAANNSLAKVAVNYWRTQNLSARAGPCDGGAAPSASPASLSAGAIAGIVAGSVAALALLGIGAKAWWASALRPQPAAGSEAAYAALQANNK